jgi:hypothetical protein
MAAVVLIICPDSISRQGFGTVGTLMLVQPALPVLGYDCSLFNSCQDRL